MNIDYLNQSQLFSSSFVTFFFFFGINWLQTTVPLKLGETEYSWGKG